MLFAHAFALVAMPCLDVQDAYASSTCCQDETAVISNMFQTTCSSTPRFTAVCSEMDERFAYDLAAFDETALYAQSRFGELRVVRVVRQLLQRDPTPAEVAQYAHYSYLDLQHVVMERDNFPGKVSGLDVVGKRALVVGGSTGIGFATAVLLAQRGAPKKIFLSCKKMETPDLDF